MSLSASKFRLLVNRNSVAAVALATVLTGAAAAAISQTPAEAAISDYQRVIARSETGGSDIKFVSAVCPVGYKVSGGASQVSAFSPTRVDSNASIFSTAAETDPTTGAQQWTVRAKSSSPDWQLLATAFCIR